MFAKGDWEVAILVRQSASSLLAMLVCPGTQYRVTGIMRSRRLPIVLRISRAVSWPEPLSDLEAWRIVD
jgi:DNA-binding IclR family transcriptional regulator